MEAVFDLQLTDFVGDTIFKGYLHKKDILTYLKVPADVFLQEILQLW